MPANDNAPATEPVPAAGDDGESVAGEVSIGDATFTPSLMPSPVSTPPKETLGRECGEIEGSSEVAGVDKDSIVSTPCSERDSSIFDSPVVQTPISNGKDTEYVPDTPDMRKIGEARGSAAPFLTSAKQLESLISDINRTSSCKAPGCNGELRLKNVELEGMGGDGQAHFYCSGRCGTRDICLPFSETHEESKQTVVSFALQMAFICSGANYAQYDTVLGSMGMYPVSDYKFYESIKLMEGPSTELVDEQCEIAKRK